jgi:hypothetical protein
MGDSTTFPWHMSWWMIRHVYDEKQCVHNWITFVIDTLHRSVGYIAAGFVSTVIPGFSLHDFCSLLETGPPLRRGTPSSIQETHFTLHSCQARGWQPFRPSWRQAILHSLKLKSAVQSVLPWPICLSFLLEIIFRQLRVCYYGEPSLTRGRVCNLQLLLGLASAVFIGSEFRGTHGQKSSQI